MHDLNDCGLTQSNVLAHSAEFIWREHGNPSGHVASVFAFVSAGIDRVLVVGL
jgi:hypothetical protein